MPTTLKPAKPNVSEQMLRKSMATLHRFFFVVVIIIFVAIVVAGYIFLVQPKYAALVDKQSTEEQSQTGERERLLAYISKLSKYRDEYGQISVADKNKIDTMIAGKYLPETVFTDMEKFIFSQGMILNSIDVQAGSTKAETSGVGEAVIKLDISGVGYDDLKKLLAIAETNLHLMDVKKINFSPGQNSATLEISTYYLK